MTRNVACTIVSNSLVPFARVLARSFLEHHEAGEVRVLIADRPDPRVGEAEPFAATYAGDLAMPAFESLAFRWAGRDLHRALLPVFLEHLLAEGGVGSLCYFAPETLVLGGLGDVYGKLEEADAVLVPTVLEPEAEKSLPAEVYDPGFLGLRRGDGVRRFLASWRAAGGDLRWLDRAPAWLPRVEVLRDPGCAASAEELGRRPLGRDGEAWRVGEAPLRFCRFGGSSPLRGEGPAPADGGAAELFRCYGERLAAAGRDGMDGIEGAWDRFSNRLRIPPVARRILARRDPGGRRWPDPFDAAGGGGFYRWLLEPLALDRPLVLPRIALEIWQERPELQQTFPEPRDEDLGDFAHWLAGRGWREEELGEPFVEAVRESLRRAGEEHRAVVDGTRTHFGNGVAIPPRAREVLGEVDPEGLRWLFPATDGPGSFYRWLLAPDDPAAEVFLPRVASLIWKRREDLKRAFPRPESDDRRAFAGWLVRHGEKDEGLAEPFLERTRASLRVAGGERFAALLPAVSRLPANGEAFAALSPGDVDWLAADAGGDLGGPAAAVDRPRVPRLAVLMREGRADLEAAFPDPVGRSRAAFAHWYLTAGRREYGLPWALVAPVFRTLPLRKRLAVLPRWWRRGPRPAPAGPEASPSPASLPEGREGAAGDLEVLRDTWELLAQSDPLWAILSEDGKRQGRWDLQEFFDTGSEEVASVLRDLKELGVELDKSAALDFGCGAGRLTRALARRFDRAVGVDISETMIELARHYCREDNAAFLVNRRDDLGLLADNSFTFVYTGRVLQHIRPEVSRRYLREFFRVLAPGGLAVFQVPGAERGGTVEEAALPAAAFRAELAVEEAPAQLTAGHSAVIAVRVTNASSVPWPSVEELGVHQIRLANQWLDAGGRVVVRDQARVALGVALSPGESRTLEIVVWPPSRSGPHVCRIDLVQEHVAWFSARGSAPLDLAVEVLEAAEPTAGDEELVAHPDIEMHTLPRDEVVRLIEESGGEVLEITEDRLAGPEWISLTYRARKSAGYRPFLHQHPAPPGWRSERRPARRDWSDLARPWGPDRPGLNRYLERLWRANPYLQETFPLTSPEGCAAFLGWVRQHGEKLDLQSWLLPDAGGPPAGETVAPSAAGGFAAGVNLIGHPDATLGIREDARANAAALQAAAVPFALASVFNTEKQESKARAAFPHRVNLLHVNADQMFPTFGRLGPQAFDERYNVGYWLWELPRFPPEWWPSFELVDEVWVPSRYVWEALARVAPVPVVQLPYPVVAEPATGLSRADFSLPERDFLFLFSFDARSWVARKNPLAAVRAFQTAFGSGERHVGLVVKAANLEPAAPLWREIREAAEEDPRLFLFDEYLPRERLLALVELCDAYLSLHRSEGFGRGPAEAMLLGKPVVVTAYSGSEEYATAETACRVDFRLVPVGEDEYLFPEGQVWAEPDVEHAAWHLRRLVEDCELRRRLAAAGRRLIRATYSPHVVGQRYRRRLEALGLL